MKEQYILTVDQGTSVTKAIIFDENGKPIERYNTVQKQYFPGPGWVEHRPWDIYENTLLAIRGVMEYAGLPREKIKGLTLTNQRETVLVWDRYTGEPIYNAIVWQCQRGGQITRELMEQGFGEITKNKTGLVLSPYFSASKIKWILDHIKGARARAEGGELVFGTVDTWLLWQLAGGKVHATDYTNACRTQLFNIEELQWDEDLFNIFTIPKAMAPKVKYSEEIFGYTTAGGIFEKDIPITGIIGDSHGALFGQKCFKRGMAKATYGTGSSIMMNIGKKPIISKGGIVTSIAWGIDGSVEYVLEGNINSTGDTIKWLVENLELIPNARAAGPIAESISDNGGVYLVPAFVGLGAPYWDSEARAIITGIGKGTKKAHIVRAAEESIAYQIKDIVEEIVEETGINLSELRADGGPTRDDFLMQFQADMLEVPVVRSNVEEFSAMGSAYIGGLALGFWNDKEDIQDLRSKEEVFYSNMSSNECNRLYSAWKQEVKRSLSKYA